MFSKGAYCCREIVDEGLDEIRIEIEKMDSFEGFMILHSLGGGTGSGV